MTFGVHLLLAGLLSPAWAQSEPEIGLPALSEPAPSSTSGDDSRARELFMEGDAHYAAGRYEEAAIRFHEAYQLSARPELLFNLANVYERLTEYDRAAEYLRRYLQSPGVDDVESARQRLRRLELAKAELETNTLAPPDPAEQTVAVVPEAGVEIVEPTETRSRSGTAGTVVLASLTGVGAATAVTFGQLARWDHQSIEQLCRSNGDDQLCTPDAEVLIARERSRALSSDLATVATSVSAIALVTHLVLRQRKRRSESRAVLVPTPIEGGAVVGMTYNFGGGAP
ncbi:MAG: hypothetical protein KTR31_41475 [Myxococcales bacterium]|nr:hypothetical protein [Myxococcales bacterium]